MQKRKMNYIILTLVFLVGLPVWSKGFAAGLQAVPGFETPPQYTLAFFNTHTRENLVVTYREAGQYKQAEMEKVNHFLRDHRNGHSHAIDGALLDLLHDLQAALQKNHPGLKVEYQIISGYRSKATNDMLRAAGGGQGKKSQHIEGKAVDIRIPGVAIEEIRDTAWCLQRGGVGYYKGSDFVHVDTGKARFWNWQPNGKTCAGKGQS